MLFSHWWNKTTALIVAYLRSILSLHNCVRKKLYSDILFNPTHFRLHLQKCFETRTMAEFPTYKTASHRRKKNVNVISIQNYCICNLPACATHLIQCDHCSMSYHVDCVNTHLMYHIVMQTIFVNFVNDYCKNLIWVAIT